MPEVQPEPPGAAHGRARRACGKLAPRARPARGSRADRTRGEHVGQLAAAPHAIASAPCWYGQVRSGQPLTKRKARRPYSTPTDGPQILAVQCPSRIQAPFPFVR